MNFKDALKAIRYSFLLSKKLNLQINDIQLAALSLDYQQSKAAIKREAPELVLESEREQARTKFKSAVEQAKVAEDATQAAQEAAAEAGEAEEKVEAAPQEEQPAALGDSPLFKQFCDLKKSHPDALLLFRSGDVYKCYEEDAIKAAEILVLTDISSTDDNITVACFPHHALDTYLPKLIRAGIRVAICDDITDFVKKPSKKPTEIVAPVQQELFTEA